MGGGRSDGRRQGQIKGASYEWTRSGEGEGGAGERVWSEQKGGRATRGVAKGRCGQMGVATVSWERCGQMGAGTMAAKGGGVSHSQVATVSLDALGGAEALAVAGVAHGGVAITLAG